MRSHEAYSSLKNSIAFIRAYDSLWMVYERLALGIMSSGKGTLFHTFPVFSMASVYPNAENQNLYLNPNSVCW